MRSLLLVSGSRPDDSSNSRVGHGDEERRCGWRRPGGKLCGISASAQVRQQELADARPHLVWHLDATARRGQLTCPTVGIQVSDAGRAHGEMALEGGQRGRIESRSEVLE